MLTSIYVEYRAVLLLTEYEAKHNKVWILHIIDFQWIDYTNRKYLLQYPKTQDTIFRLLLLSNCPKQIATNRGLSSDDNTDIRKEKHSDIDKSANNVIYA